MRFVHFHFELMSHILNILVVATKLCTIYQMWMLNKTIHNTNFLLVWNLWWVHGMVICYFSVMEANRRQLEASKYQTFAQATILLCTCLRAAYRKANRVIAVNELYVLLSDQNCKCDTFASGIGNKTKTKPGDIYPHTLSTNIKYNLSRKIYFVELHIKCSDRITANLIAFTGNWNGQHNPVQVQINYKLLHR